MSTGGDQQFAELKSVIAPLLSLCTIEENHLRCLKTPSLSNLSTHYSKASIKDKYVDTQIGLMHSHSNNLLRTLIPTISYVPSFQQSPTLIPTISYVPSFQQSPTYPHSNILLPSFQHSYPHSNNLLRTLIPTISYPHSNNLLPSF